MAVTVGPPDTHRAGPQQRRPRWRRRLLAFMVPAALIGAGLYAGLLAHDVWDETTAGRNAFNQGLTLLDQSPLTNLTPQRLTAAAADFQRAQDSFTRARDRLGPWGDWVTAHRSLLPGPAAQLASAALLLDLGRDTAASVATLSNGLRPVDAALREPAPANATSRLSAARGDTLVRVTAALDSARPALNRAADQFGRARAERRRLADLPPVAAAATLLATFDRRAQQVTDALTYAQSLPAMLGAHGTRSYLVVYQDTADLRATGGFIGSATVLILDHGRLAQLDYETTAAQPSLNLQMPYRVAGPPPVPLLYYRNLGSFQLRDANFWPDYPTSARHIAERYLKATNRQVDGVVAVNPAAITYLLGALGSLAVPGFPEALTAANVAGRIEYYSHNRPGAVSDPHRNRFLVVTSHAVFDRLLHANGSQVSAIVSAIEQGFADRSIMLSVTDPLIAQALHQLRWDGALRTDGGDYLGVYDQNVTDSKLNPYVDQTIAYTAIRQADGSLLCQLSITYTNHTAHAAFWIARTFYQDYLRIAVPSQSTVESQTGYDESFWPNETEHGRLLIAGGFLVLAGQARTISVSYHVPASALAGLAGYRLLVQQQPGRRPASLSVRVSADGRTWAVRTTLLRDTVFSTPWNAPSGMLQLQGGQ